MAWDPFGGKGRSPALKKGPRAQLDEQETPTEKRHVPFEETPIGTSCLDSVLLRKKQTVTTMEKANPGRAVRGMKKRGAKVAGDLGPLVHRCRWTR